LIPAVTRDLPPPVAVVTATAVIATAAPRPTHPRKRGALRVFEVSRLLLLRCPGCRQAAACLQSAADTTPRQACFKPRAVV
jgi:hypothetical protein